MSPRTLALTPYLLLASLSLFWGLNWPGIKIIVSEVPVWWFRALCLIGGGSILMTLSALSGNRCRLQAGELGPILLCGSFAILGWMVCSAYGVSLMPAGRASIVAFTMPLWATLIAAYVLGERLTASKLSGLMLGLIGLGVLIGPDLADPPARADRCSFHADGSHFLGNRHGAGQIHRLEAADAEQHRLAIADECDTG